MIGPKLAQALVKFQSQLGGAKKDSVNPHFKSKYADLQSVFEAIQEPLAKNGLSVIQLLGDNEQGLPTITTQLIHESGEFITSTKIMTVTKKDPQGEGSAITYYRRYTLCAMLGVYNEDDDGNSASPKATEHTYTKSFSESRAATQKTQGIDDYVIPFGALKGRKLVSCNLEDIQATITWLKTNTLNDSGKQFLMFAENHFNKLTKGK
jgi:hypothetical protein